MRPQRGPLQKRHVVTATLISGGAAGLLLLAPSLANAAEPVTEVLTQQAPPTTEPTATADTTAEDDAAAPDAAATDDESTESGRVDRLRELLQPLVDDGTLTAEQADAVVDELQSAEIPAIWMDGPMVVQGGPGGQGFPGNMGFPGGQGMPGHIEIERPGGAEVSIHVGFEFGTVTADLVANTIGIDVSDLITQLRDGSTIADVATANGVDPQAVIDAVVQHVTDQLTAAVDSGRLTQEEADERLANATERITDFVNGEQPEAPADTAPADTAADVTETTTSA